MRRLRSALAATATRRPPPDYTPAAAPNTAFLSSPISPAKLAKIDEMLTLTGVKPIRLKTIDQGKERLNWNAKVQAGTLTQVPKEKGMSRAPHPRGEAQRHCHQGHGNQMYRSVALLSDLALYPGASLRPARFVRRFCVEGR
jgi:hypothetical protein